MWRIGIFVRPSSTVSWTGMSRIRSRSLVGAPAAVPAASVLKIGAGRTSAGGLAAAAAGAVHSGSAVLVGPSSRAASHVGILVGAQHALDAQGVAAVEDPVLALHHRHVVDLAEDGVRNVDRQDVAGLEVDQVLEAQACRAEPCDEVDLGRLHLLRERTDPAAIGLRLVA